jgi:hypothetical protein
MLIGTPFASAESKGGNNFFGRDAGTVLDLSGDGRSPKTILKQKNPYEPPVN